MTGPAIDPMDQALAKIRAGQGPAPPGDMDAALAKIRSGGTQPDIHAEYKSGALAARMSAENAADSAADEPQTSFPTKVPSGRSPGSRNTSQARKWPRLASDH